jgi:hypothetical protein
VLRWTISERGAFHDIGGTPVAAMAICQYPGASIFYLFKCAADWDVIGDWDCESIDECLRIAAQHAKDERLVWHEA